jgi:hypothetical protein
MSIALASGSDATRDTLRAALPDLHHELAKAGLQDISLSLDTSTSDTSRGHQQPHRPLPNSTSNGPSGPDGASATGQQSQHRQQPTRARPALNNAIDRWL